MKKFFPYLLTIILIVPSFLFLLRPHQYWNMHDDMQIVRQLSLEKCISDLQIPCRWSPDLGYGYGFPLFNFYPPFPYIVGQVFRTLGFSFISTVKLTAVLQIILSASFMFLLASAIFGSLGGILAAVLYTYAPYHALNIYVRGAMNEAWAAVFFPLIFYYLRKITLKPSLFNSLLLSISILFLALSHNPMLLTFVPIAGIWFLYCLYHNRQNWLHIIKYSIVSASLAFGLSAFFLLPLIFETKLVQIDTMFTNYYHFSVHFVSLFQLFISNFWGDGPSVWGTADGMSFSIGYVHWLFPLLIFVSAIFPFLKRRLPSELHRLAVIFALMGFFAAFLTHQRSDFLWNLLPPLQKIQFPWRILNHVVFLFSLSSAYLASKFRHTPILIILFLILPILLNLSKFSPVTSGPITDAQKMQGQAWTNQITSGIYDYLPKTAPTAPKALAKDYIDDIYPSQNYQLLNPKKGSDWQSFNITLEKPATITFPVLFFPDFRLFVDGNLTQISSDKDLGRITAVIPSGTHSIYLKLFNTPIRNISNIISLVSLIIFLFLSLYTRNYGHKHS